MDTTTNLASEWERQVREWKLRRHNVAEARHGTCPAQSRGRQNVGTLDRVASLVGGAVLVSFGRRKGNAAGAGLALAGAGLIYRGATGHCFCYEALGITTAPQNANSVVPAKQGVQVEKTIRVNRPVDELYELWRDLTNLPRVFTHLESVDVQDGHSSHWVAKGPRGISVEWDAEVLNDHENRLIAWRSLPESQVDTAGSVRFKSIDGDSTEVTVTLRYNPPGGKLADYVASWLGSDLESILDEDLQHLEQAMDLLAWRAIDPT